MTKLFCPHIALAVTSNAVERMMRDAKVTQIGEGTNQI